MPNAGHQASSQNDKEMTCICGDEDKIGDWIECTGLDEGGCKAVKNGWYHKECIPDEVFPTAEAEKWCCSTCSSGGGSNSSNNSTA